jgi:hypothetical protein
MPECDVAPSAPTVTPNHRCHGGLVQQCRAAGDQIAAGVARCALAAVSACAWRSPVHGSDPPSPGAIERIDWIAAYRDGTEPLKHQSAMPEIPEPTPDDLRPHLNGGNPYGQDHATDGSVGGANRMT